jgi:hypothetical protein
MSNNVRKFGTWAPIVLAALALLVGSHARAEEHVLEGTTNATVAANTSILTTAITPDSRTAQLAITVGVTSTGSVINVIMEDQSGGTNRTFSLNGGVALTAGADYAFAIDVSPRFKYNFQPATTTAVTMVVRSVKNDRR